MPGYFVFVRFFLGYSETFPFERFIKLHDNDIADAVETLRKEWWSKPANRKQVEESRKALRKRQEEWSEGCLAVPLGSHPKPLDSNAGVEVYQVPSGTPDFEELAREAEWKTTSFQAGCSGISRRYPVAFLGKKALADNLAGALQLRVAELADAAYLKNHWDDETSWLAQANPRFSVVPEEKLSGSEVTATKERIQRINDPAGTHLSLDEAILRFYLIKIRPILDQFNAPADSAPPLTEAEGKVLELIKQQPKGQAITGPEIISSLNKQGFPMEQSTLTRHIIPKLKKGYGVKNRRGVGYYVDAP
jgi:hypothetical protein